MQRLCDWFVDFMYTLTTFMVNNMGFMGLSCETGEPWIAWPRHSGYSVCL